MKNITFWSVLAHMCGGPVEGKTICKIKNNLPICIMKFVCVP